MADRITRPQGLGLTFSPGRAVGSPYGNAGAAMIAANRTIADTPNKTAQMFAGINAGLKGLGSGIKDYQENANQAGLRRVLQGGQYNAPTVWDKISATMGHAADGTLGQHAGDQVPIRSTPMDRHPENVIIGANGQMHYDPTAGARGQLDAEKVKQLQADNARAAKDDARAAKPPVKLIDGKRPSTGTATPTTDMKNEPPINGAADSSGKPNDSDEYLNKGPKIADGSVTVPGVPVPGVVNPTATATAGSPLADQPATATATPGSFDYSAAAMNPAALNAAVTPGGDFNYSGQSPLSGSMLGPGDVYNAFGEGNDFNDSGGLASSFGPAPFEFNGGDSYDASQGLYAGGDYSAPQFTDSPLSDMPTELPVDAGAMYG